jgi:hypothetical protein
MSRILFAFICVLSFASSFVLWEQWGSKIVDINDISPLSHDQMQKVPFKRYQKACDAFEV